MGQGYLCYQRDMMMNKHSVNLKLSILILLCTNSENCYFNILFSHELQGTVDELLAIQNQESALL